MMRAEWGGYVGWAGPVLPENPIRSDPRGVLIRFRLDVIPRADRSGITLDPFGVITRA